MQRISTLKAEPLFSKPSSDLILNELLKEIQLFASLLKTYGISIQSESPKARTSWAALPAAAKSNILTGFSNYARNCLELHASGVSLRDNRALLTHCLAKIELQSKEDLMTFLEPSDLVEIYNLDHIQLFRSINFFDYCNYSMLDLLAREWFDLYERLDSITEQAMGEFQGTLSSGLLRKLTIPLHVLKERDSSPAGIFQFDFRFCCPLIQKSGASGGYLLTERVSEIGLFWPNADGMR